MYRYDAEVVSMCWPYCRTQLPWIARSRKLRRLLSKRTSGPRPNTRFWVPRSSLLSLVLSPQSFGQVLRNTIYIGRIDCPEYEVSTRGNFDPLVNEQTFYRAQAV